MIGDPKPDVERPLLSIEEITTRSEKLKKQAEKILGGIQVELVNNYDWLGKLELILFLRDTGKYFTVNSLIKKDAISARMESEEGISFTEFSYPLLQAYDFWHLYTEYKCDVQIGGSDQWGNIVAGVELIRRKENKTAYALTIPIIVDKASGKKFGKSEQGAVWLDPKKTIPYQFYQFWLTVEDEMAEECLLKMTLLSKAEIDAVMHMHKRDKGERHPQRLLARTVTTLVHGEAAAEAAEAVSNVLFGGAAIADLSAVQREQLKMSAPTFDVQVGTSLIDLLIQTKLASSKREAKQFVSAKGVSINQQVVTDAEAVLDPAHFQNGVALLKRGKRTVVVLNLVER